MSPTWGTHGCVTLPNLLPRLILYLKPLYNPCNWIALLNEMMPSTDLLTPISRLRIQDWPTFLTRIADDSTFKQQDHSGNLSLTAGLPTQKSRQTSRQTSRSHDEHRNGPNQPLETVLDLLTHNAAYQQLDSNANELATGDEVIFVKASHSPIDNILCGSEQSSSFLISNREIITGWPSSFSHADCDYFAKLATCYLIKFQSYMCYAVTALRVLTHAPWNDNMFHGHIRELVLCAIGNGWTWADQTATVQGRRVSIGEVCCCFC